MMPCVGFSETLNLGNTISDVGLPPRRLGMYPVKGHHGVRIQAVSYTHLDVYKRQPITWIKEIQTILR